MHPVHGAARSGPAAQTAVIWLCCAHLFSVASAAHSAPAPRCCGLDQAAFELSPSMHIGNKTPANAYGRNDINAFALDVW